jgi:hypothetical protein
MLETAQQVQASGCHVDGVASFQAVIDVDRLVEGSLRVAVMEDILSLLFGIADRKRVAKSAECRVFVSRAESQPAKVNTIESAGWAAIRAWGPECD